MLPPIPARLAEAGRMLLSRYSGALVQKNGKPQYRLPKFNVKPIKFRLPNIPDPFVAIRKNMRDALPEPIHTLRKNMRAAIPDPVHTLRKGIKGVSSTVSRLTKQNSGEDYNAILKKFVPPDSKLVVPKYPSNSKDIFLADLDGDSQKELVATYRHSEGLRTIILKKQNGHWSEAGQTDHPGYHDVNFRGTTDITGEGKKHLLLGLTANGKYGDLHGYSIEENNINKMFSKRYHKFEVIEPPKNRIPSTGAHLAIWNKKEDADADDRINSASRAIPFNVDVVRWNGSDFEPAAKPAPYFHKSVIPYYAGKVKMSPRSPANWYHLADALVQGEANRDALDAIEIGMRQDKKNEYKDRFLEMKEWLTIK